MITDMLEQMNRRQLNMTAAGLKIAYSKYPSKRELIDAIRKKRAA